MLVNALRPSVPVGHPSLRIEHKNRIIGDALNKQPEAPFAFRERSLHRTPFGDIAFECSFNTVSMLDLTSKGVIDPAQLQCALVYPPLQVLISSAKFMLRDTTGRDILDHQHEIPNRATRIENSRDTVPDPNAS